MRQPTNNNELEETDEISLADLFYKYLAYWPYFLFLILISMLGAWFYLRYTLPVYKTTATLLIKDDKNSTPGKDLQDAFDMFGSKKNVENEVEVLQSKTLMQEVVRNLHLYAPIMIEARVLKQSAYVLSPIVIEAQDPDSLKFALKIPFTYNKAAQTLKIENVNYPLNQWVTTPFGIL